MLVTTDIYTNIVTKDQVYMGNSVLKIETIIKTSPVNLSVCMYLYSHTHTHKIVYNNILSFLSLLILVKKSLQVD